MLEFRVARDNFQRFKQGQESCIMKRGKRRQSATESSDEQIQSNEAASDIPYHNSVAAIRLSSSSIPMVIPNLYDEQGWRRLLYGAQTSGSGEGRSAEGIQPDTTAKGGLTESAVESSAAALSEVLEKSSGTVTTPRTARDQANQYQGISPHPRFLVRLNQGHLVQLLKYHLRWLAEDDLTDHEVLGQGFVF